nr:MAG TPA: hypothetical protein [Caudoviricetes sp.]
MRSLRRKKIEIRLMRFNNVKNYFTLPGNPHES